MSGQFVFLLVVLAVVLTAFCCELFYLWRYPRDPWDDLR